MSEIETTNGVDVETDSLGSGHAAAMKGPAGLSRRDFLRVLGAGVVITVPGVSVLAQSRRRRGRGGFWGRGANIPIAARVHIGADGKITVMTGKVEGGQGARTEITEAAAEELRLTVAEVALIMADTGLVPNDGITAGSRTTPSTIPAVRKGCAAAREMLISLAATKWGIDRKAVVLQSGKAIDRAHKRTLSYADLATTDQAEKLFKQNPPSGVKLTPVKQWKVMGVSHARTNAGGFVTGEHKFPSDLDRPGMLYGRVLRPPSYGAKLTGLDATAARKMPGVTVVHSGDFVGVTAPTLYAANQAISALEAGAKWASSPHPSSKEIYDYLRKHARRPENNPFAAVLSKAHKALRQTYHVAYVQHAPLEPRVAVAEWKGDSLTVWVGTQNPFGCRSFLAREFGLSQEKIRVIVPDFGAAYGGKHRPDADIEAARLAKAVGKPVKVRWTRPEEFTWAYFRPAAVIDVQASLDAEGKITSWHFVNINSGGSAVRTPYDVRADCRYVRSDSPLRQGSYRCLAATANNFARESFMDELAYAAGIDPLAFRLAHLKDARLIAVLREAAKQFGWASRFAKKTPGVGVGLACGSEKGSVVAACAEVAVRGSRIHVRRVCQAFECGKIINPDNLLAQNQGCIMMGLGPALREQITFERGTVTDASFWRYRVPRFADLPALDVHLMDRPNIPSAGAGETPIIAVAPAVANAVFHATGKRIRQMPLTLDGDGKA